MYATNFPTGFNIDSFVEKENPFTFGLFNSESGVKQDLSDLFVFAEENKDSMPFYVVNKKEIESVANTSERVYAALCNAVDYLCAYPDEIEHYFGKEFCQEYPEFLKYALWTYQNDHEAMYGRFDMAMDPDRGEITGVYEFNGNTPVMLFESTVLQNWLVEQVNNLHGMRYDQHNEYYANTAKNLKRALHKGDRKNPIKVGILFHSQFIEDAATCETIYNMFDNIDGVEAYIDDIDNIQYDKDYKEKGMLSPFSVSGINVTNLFVLQPWEEIVESCYDDVIKHWEDWKNHVSFFEPAWRWFISNKGIWALMTHLLKASKEYRDEYGDLPILETYMSPDYFLQNGLPFVQKPLNGRLSNNIVIHDGSGDVSFESDGMYEDAECIYQAFCEPGKVPGRNNFIVGQWMALYKGEEPQMMEASCFCIREFDKPVLDIKNERFIPHLLEK